MNTYRREGRERYDHCTSGQPWQGTQCSGHIAEAAHSIRILQTAAAAAAAAAGLAVEQENSHSEAENNKNRTKLIRKLNIF